VGFSSVSHQPNGNLNWLRCRRCRVDGIFATHCQDADAVPRDNQGERAYCLTGECYPASNRCLIEMLPLPHVPGTEIPKTLFPHRKSLFVVVKPVELWATRQRRPSAAANPQGSCRHLCHSRTFVLAVQVDRRSPEFTRISQPYFASKMPSGRCHRREHGGFCQSSHRIARESRAICRGGESREGARSPRPS
jgi:hypothetical protein